jgi:hypothetical protein
VRAEVLGIIAMPDPAAIPNPLRAPPRVDVSQVSKPLQDSLAGWDVNLAQPFRGLTASGEVEGDLFPLRKTGATLKPMRDAVAAFIVSLDDSQREAVFFDVDGKTWRTWSNIHRNLMRHGLCLVELGETQRELAYGILRASFGAEAYETARSAMKLNETLAEMTKLPLEFGEYFNWISLFGGPSEENPWGWQLDGHRCNINCFALGDQMVLSPMLLGSEPILAEAGKYKGLTVLRAEEARGFAFMGALTPEQRKAATIGMDLPFDGYASGFQDNVVVPYAGVISTAITPAQRGQLLDLIRLYTDRLMPGQAEVRFKEVEAHFDNTYFSWIGEFGDEAPFYYRVHSPVIFIEFYHRPGVALPNTGYNRRHAHALVRTPNGNDCGRELLRQYRAQSK